METIFEQLIQTYPTIPYKFFTPPRYFFMIVYMVLAAIFFTAICLLKYLRNEESSIYHPKKNSYNYKRKKKLNKNMLRTIEFMIALLLLLLIVFIVQCLNDTYKTTSAQIIDKLNQELYLTTYDSPYSIVESITESDDILYLKDEQNNLLIEFNTATKKITALTINGEVLIKEYDKLIKEEKQKGKITLIEYQTDKSNLPTIRYMQNNQIKNITYTNGEIQIINS